ncbi:MAG: glycoside hydrolase family 5 protein [Oscillospiraceae bacterium]|nr:glycoside hydrolase family 5 protein [Oscillospiraceae bacterium]
MKQDYGFRKGINFGGWMSQCDYSEDRLNNFITEKDFAQVADWGFDHVRIPVDYNILEKEDGSVLEDGYQRLANALALCKKYGLRLIIDLHKTAGFSFDTYAENESGFFENEKYQARFYALWEEMARRFGAEETVAFELLNEVTDKEFIDAWNRIAKECIRRIRAIAPQILILVGSYWNNSAETVEALEPPYDSRVIYNMHCYEPLVFTHQGAYWTDRIDPEKRMKFEESETSLEYFENLFASAIAKTNAENTGLYCGEYGVISFVTPEDAVKWFRCINTVFKKYGIGRAMWNYKEMDFGLTDPRLDGVREELLQYC